MNGKVFYVHVILAIKQLSLKVSSSNQGWACMLKHVNSEVFYVDGIIVIK